MATLDPSEIMFTPFEPKTKNRFIMYIEGIPILNQNKEQTYDSVRRDSFRPH